MKEIPGRAKELMSEMDQLGAKIKKANRKYERLKKELEKEFVKADLNVFEIDDGQPRILRALRIDASSVVYDYNKLKQNVDKSIFRQLISWHVDKDKVNVAYQKGLIKMKMLKKCASLKPSFRISVSRVNRSNEGE